MLSGILPVDKPLGWTSHDVVARVRRLVGQKAVGHAGTLDPLATGLLLVVLGEATKLSSSLMEGEKIYRVEVVLGATTVTDDAEAPLATRAPLPPLSLAQIEACLQRLVGTIAQTPPRYAAVKRGGQTLYSLARRGIEVEPEPRQVTIRAIELEGWEVPRLSLRVTCAPGTYIRSLARDIGACLGVGGYVHALRRVASGSFSVAQAAPLATLQTRPEVIQALEPPDRAVVHLPAAVLTTEQARQVRHGAAVPVGGNAANTVRLYGPDGQFLALAEARDQGLKPFRVFATEGDDADCHRSG